MGEYILGMLVGILVGGWVTNSAWRRNASVIQRHSCGNRLYKVYDVTDLLPMHLDKEEYVEACYNKDPSGK